MNPPEPHRHPSSQQPSLAEVLVFCKRCEAPNCVQPKAPITPALQAYRCHSCGHPLHWIASQSYSVDLEDEFSRDVWDIRRLAFHTKPEDGRYKLNFNKLSQPWLHQSTKEFIKFTLSTLSIGSAQTRLSSLNKFSEFLT
ncbi:MAG: hypothetical protein AAF329_18230, partial [Cyanobacteria bacterium P01_A01_bin.17]